MPCEWCGESVPYPRRRYCCGSCENAAIRHAADAMDALLNGEDPPDKPEHTH